MATLGITTDDETRITGWSIDSRTLAAGDLFFALKGPNHDGSQYVSEVLAKGASAALVETCGGPHVYEVPDTLAALQRIASWARGKWAGDVVGVTGSAGKTSTKDVIAALLSVGFTAGKTEGNFNNQVGLPLSILRLPDAAEVAVLEIGMNHAGEIRELARIARPRIAVVTNVGYAHIEFFESIEDIAAAKRELIEALPTDGIAVLNADDARVLRFREAHHGKTITFGIDQPADVRATDIEHFDGGARFRIGEVAFETRLPGRHGILNILAGVAVAGLYGIAPERLTGAIARLAPGKMRGERLVHRGILVLNDCYNSNPDAARSMIDTLRDTPARRRIAVLGEMLELGRWSESLHRGVGRYAAEQGISALVGIRGAAQSMVDAAIQAGLSKDTAFFFNEPAEAGVALRGIARDGDVVLFKGSRGAHVEQALERFMAD